MNDINLKAEAIHYWTKGDIAFSLRTHSLRGLGYNWYCGYCQFPKRPLIATGYSEIATYVPVHGGITFAHENSDGSMIYGFDCSHAGDEDNSQLRDTTWLKAECERMAQAIQVASVYEPEYLLAATNEAKAVILYRYHVNLIDDGINFFLGDNLGAMINVMFGKL